MLIKLVLWILIGKHTYTCYVSAILAYIPFGCLHYRSHYFVPNLYWTNLQSKRRKKRKLIKRWARSDDRIHFMDSLYRLIQLSTEWSPYCLFSVLFFFFSWSLAARLFSSHLILLSWQKCLKNVFLFRPLEQIAPIEIHWTEQTKIASSKQKPKSQVYQIDSPIRFQWNVNNNWVGRLSKVCAAKKKKLNTNKIIVTQITILCDTMMCETIGCTPYALTVHSFIMRRIIR